MARFRPKILVTTGALRAGGPSGALAALVVQTLARRDVDVTRLSLADHPLPFCDAEMEAGEAVPEAARRLQAFFCDHHGVFIVTPEWGASLPPVLKNALDWIGRVRPPGPKAPGPWRERVFALGSAAPGPFGGLRALMHLRQVLEQGFGATVIPDDVAVTFADGAFAADGGLREERAARDLEAMLDRLVEEAARHAG